MIEEVLSLIIAHKEWLFSGAGLSVLGLIYWLIKLRENNTQPYNRSDSANVTINIDQKQLVHGQKDGDQNKSTNAEICNGNKIEVGRLSRIDGQKDDIDFYVNNQIICRGSLVKIVFQPKLEDTQLCVWSEIKNEDRYAIILDEQSRFRLQYVNTSSRALNTNEYQYSIMHQRCIEIGKGGTEFVTVELPTGQNLTKIDMPTILRPGEWVTTEYFIYLKPDYLTKSTIDAILQYSNDTGQGQIPFNFQLELDCGNLAKVFAEQPEASKSKGVIALEECL